MHSCTVEWIGMLEMPDIQGRSCGHETPAKKAERRSIQFHGRTIQFHRRENTIQRKAIGRMRSSQRSSSSLARSLASSPTELTSHRYPSHFGILLIFENVVKVSFIRALKSLFQELKEKLPTWMPSGRRCSL